MPKLKKETYLAVLPKSFSDICDTLVWALREFASILLQEAVNSLPPYIHELCPESWTLNCLNYLVRYLVQTGIGHHFSSNFTWTG